MKAAEIKASLARGENVFAVAHWVKRHGILTTVTVGRIEKGMAVVLSRSGQEVDQRKRPADLITMAEAQALLDARAAEAAAREAELWGDDVDD